ncbi:MAG: hypothetical protein AAF848_15075 [Pseudomonadota bacterium]
MRSLALFVLLAATLTSGAVAQSLPMTAEQRESRAISAVSIQKLRHTRHLPHRYLRVARKAMIAGLDIDDNDMARLGDHKDGLAAKRYAARLIARDPVAHASDIAYYSAIAAGTGRIYALDDMIAAMHHLDPVSEPWSRRHMLIKVLYSHAWAGNVMALDAVIAFNGEGTLFGPMSDATRARVLRHGAVHDGRAELLLAMKLMARGDVRPPVLQQAMDYLQRGAESRDLTISTTSRNLIPLVVGRLAAQVASN